MMMRKRALAVLMLGLLAFVTTACLEDLFDTGVDLEPTKSLTGEAHCATYPDVGYGKAFYCATSTGNLQDSGMPSAYPGYCASTDENIGLVGYSATDSSGGSYVVRSFSGAQKVCNDLNTLGMGCRSIIRCTRE